MKLIGVVRLSPVAGIGVVDNNPHKPSLHSMELGRCDLSVLTVYHKGAGDKDHWHAGACKTRAGRAFGALLPHGNS